VHDGHLDLLRPLQDLRPVARVAWRLGDLSPWTD
jgi:hypothetical protein